MNRYWSARLTGIDPYVPGEQPRGRKFIKINTNENPYPPSPEALAALRASAGPDMRLYPDPDSGELVSALAGCYSVRPGQVFVGNGSDEVLAFSFQAFFDPGRPILFADITYSFYPIYARFFGIDYKTIPLDGDFDLPAEEFRRHSGGVVIANPNAPTGKALTLSDIEKIVKADESRVVIVDEAYVDFGAESAVSMISRYPNLLVVHTMSKSRALAGMRVGYALGDENLIRALECVKNSINSYTVDRVAQKVAAAAVRDRAYFEETCGRIIETREKTTLRLREMGFTVLDSKANFLFISHEKKPAEELFHGLREKGILVRYFDRERIQNFLRVTIGQDRDMEIFCESLEGLL